MKLNPLTPEETRVIENKGTEAPFSGEYEMFSEPGIFTCRRCGAYLYRSEDKFDAHCGWPSFDQEILGAVTRQLDADGKRTEITCTRCGAHLGHVFEGEGFTPLDTRHCVNSISLKHISPKNVSHHEVAYFAGGCFWCTEAAFKQVRGVVNVIPGYAGGMRPNPSYENVSTGATGHAEVIQIEYNPTIISYEALLQVFFLVHDPTTPDQQGSDIGTQYRSIILYTGDLQKELAKKYINELEEKQVYPKPIVTQIEPFKVFYPAEDYHHDYYQNNSDAPYCNIVITPKLNKLRHGLSRYLIST